MTPRYTGTHGESNKATMLLPVRKLRTTATSRAPVAL
jgi:hypothetical protein